MCKTKQKHFLFQSHIWIWSLILYKISFNKQKNWNKPYNYWWSHQVWSFFTFWGDLAYCVPWEHPRLLQACILHSFLYVPPAISNIFSRVKIEREAAGSCYTNDFIFQNMNKPTTRPTNDQVSNNRVEAFLELSLISS